MSEPKKQKSGKSYLTKNKKPAKKQKEEKIVHYSLKNILKIESHYKVIFGERSNGKTFAIKHLGLFGFHEDGLNIKGYLDDGKQLAIIRRYEEDYTGKQGASFFDDIINNSERGNILQRLSKNKWNSIHYRAKQWFLQQVDDEGEVIVRDSKPFAIGFALNSEEHYKGNSYPHVGKIFFDEFIARKMYLIDEFVTFTNLLSTLIRLRDDIPVFMCGNTINAYNPYFIEMGLKHAKNMEKGTIEIYEYQFEDDKQMRVAVEYSDFPSKKKASNIYFAFDNPKLKMITEGKFELPMYPHLPEKYIPKEIVMTYFIKFDGDIYQAEIIAKKDKAFTYIHRRTKEISEESRDIIYQQDYDARPNYSRKITKATNKAQSFICGFFQREKVYYQDNEVGNAIENYILWCRQN